MFDLNKKINKIKNNKKFIILITAFVIMSCGGNCDSLDKSFTSYDNAIEVNPEINDFRVTISDYDKVLLLDTKNFEGYAQRGVAKFKIKNMVGALNGYNLAIEINPKMHTLMEVGDF